MRKTVVLVALVLLAPLVARAEAWRGLVPLRSTRVDAERLLGKPLRANDVWMVYESPKETALISLITGDSDSPGLPGGTVHHIEIIPKNTLSLFDLGLDENKIARHEPLNPGSSMGFEGYVDEGVGLIVRTNDRRVETIFYFASATDRKLCPACYPNAKVLADVPICRLCPTLAVTSPEEALAGEKILFAANFAGSSLPVSYKWTFNVGTIVDGQGTPNVTVRTDQGEQQAVNGTVEIEGLDPSCNSKAMSTTHLKRKT